MLKNMSKLIKNIVSKNLIISKVFFKKILEFLLRHRILGFEAIILLILLLDYCPTEKQDSKKDSI